MSDPDVEKLGEAAAIPRDLNHQVRRTSNSSLRMTNAAMPHTSKVQDFAGRPPNSLYISGACVSEPVIRTPNHIPTQGLPSTKSPIDQKGESFKSHVYELPTEKPNNEEFVARLRETYGPNVLNFSQKKKYVAVDISSLQKANLECLKSNLVESAFDFTYGATNQVESRLVEGGKWIHRYVEALRDLEYMKRMEDIGDFETFLIGTDLTSQRNLLQDVGSQWLKRKRNELDPATLTRYNDDMTFLQSEDRLGKVTDNKSAVEFGGTRSKRIIIKLGKDFARNMTMGVIGGATLVAPIFWMVLHPGVLTSLVTICTCVFGFSLGMSSSPFPKDARHVYAATIAYAAALLVCIGTANGL